jgi:hypothetical protein
MSAVVEAVSNVVSSVVETVGDVVETVVDVAEQVVETVAENPILIVAAVAAPYALSALAAETATVGALEIASTAEAVSTGAAVLEATESAVAVASAETAAATTVVQAGATVAEATTAASLVSEGATVAEAVSSATAGAVETSAMTEVASTASNTMASAWETLSNGAQNITKLIGENLIPDADPMFQKLAGQVAVNTATNGGDFGKALENTALSLGTGALGGEIAQATGSDLAGRVAANATKQLVTTGDVNLTSMAGNELGRLVGSEVADQTDSALAGKLAGSVANSVVQGRDPTLGLINTGVGALVNEGVDAAFKYAKSSGIDDSITGEDQPDVTKTGSEEDGLNAVAGNDAKNAGGLNQLITGAEDTQEPSIAPKSASVDDTINVADSTVQPAAPAADATTPVGGLSQVTEAPQAPEQPAPTDVAASVAQVNPTEEQKAANIPTKVEEEKPSAAQTVGAGAVSGALAGKLTSVLKPQLTNAITKSLIPTKPAARQQLSPQQMAAMRVAATKPTRPPIQMDVSKLMPVSRTSSAPMAAPRKVNVSTLTPVSGSSSLTSILKNIKKSG